MLRVARNSPDRSLEHQAPRVCLLAEPPVLHRFFVVDLRGAEQGGELVDIVLGFPEHLLEPLQLPDISFNRQSRELQPPSDLVRLEGLVGLLVVLVLHLVAPSLEQLLAQTPEDGFHLLHVPLCPCEGFDGTRRCPPDHGDEDESLGREPCP